MKPTKIPPKKPCTQTKTAPPKTYGWPLKNDGLEWGISGDSTLGMFGKDNLPKSTLAVYKQKNSEEKNCKCL